MRYTGKDNESTGIPDRYYRGGSAGAIMQLNGVFVAKVVAIKDDTFQGHINVELIGHQVITEKDNDDVRRQYHRVRRMMNFGGSIQDSGYSNQYGMITHPPAPGSEVLVAFTGADQEGFLLGVLPDAGRASQIPGLPAHELAEGGQTTIGPSLDAGVAVSDTTEKVRHPVSDQLAIQGLGLDSVRGLTSSGSRRESPINLFGFNTPGGHSFVMDDGTRNDEDVLVADKNRSAGENKLMRWRSKGGAQVLINDTSNIVYIGNHDGTSWIQMNSAGDIDVYSESRISLHSEDDFNLYVGGTFNLDADNINIKSRGSEGIKIENATGELNVHSAKDIKLTTDMNGHIKARGNVRISTDGLIDLNGPPATPATKTVTQNLTSNTTVKKSIAGRVPEHEPWGGHTEEQSNIAVQAPSSITNKTAKDYNLNKLQSNKSHSYDEIKPQTVNTNKNSGLGSVEPDGHKMLNPRTGRGWLRGQGGSL